jgi:RNA-directed DNA polymerase
VSQAKPFSISKKIVWEAYERAKENQGAAGVDSESIEAFEKDLKNNLYKIWNRMSSGTYFPPPVRTVAIPKKDGGERRLGIPTVSDRIAQTVAKLYLEPLVEPSFHPDSYGYRPRKSALDAVEQRGSDAGVMPGSLTWTFAASSIISTTNWCFEP